MLFTTPGLLFSGLFSLVFIFTSNQKRGSKFTGQLPPFPRLGRVVIGEFHHPRKPVAAEFPTWLTIPDRGLFTGCAVFGAIGSGKTSGCMRPFAKQVLEYRANDPHRRIGGLVMEGKGDFCYQVQKLCRRLAGRKTTWGAGPQSRDERQQIVFDGMAPRFRSQGLHGIEERSVYCSGL